MVTPSEALDVVRVLVPGGALVAVAVQLAKAVPEWVRGRAEVARVEAEAAREVAVIEATSRAKVREMVVEHELQLAREHDRPARPRRQLAGRPPSPGTTSGGPT